MSCSLCHDPITFGHQDKHCPLSLRFGLDDLDTYWLVRRDDDQRSQWYGEEEARRRKAGVLPEPDELHRSALRRLRCKLLRVFHSAFA